MYKNSWSMIRLAGLVLFFQFTLSATAIAALISVNTAFGPGTATFDSDTQQRWLDLSVSRPSSYNQVVADLSPGEQFDGYRLASTDEVSDFISNSGILPPLAGTPAFMGFQSFVTMIGATLIDVSGDGCQLGFLGIPGGMEMGGAPTAGASNMRGPLLGGGQGDCMTQTPVLSRNDFSSGFLILPNIDFNTELSDVDLAPQVGSLMPVMVSGAWLVQDVTAVSASSSLALVLLGLLALIRVAPWHSRSGIA